MFSDSHSPARLRSALESEAVAVAAALERVQDHHLAACGLRSEAAAGVLWRGIAQQRYSAQLDELVEVLVRGRDCLERAMDGAARAAALVPVGQS